MKKLLLILLFPTALFAQLELPYPVKVVNPKPLDFWYFEADGTPYDNTTEVTTQVLSAIRYRGMTFNVNGVEYWFGAGITDPDLVVKSTSFTLANGSGTTANGSAVDLGGDLTGSVSITDLAGDKFFILNLGDQSGGLAPYSIISGGTDIGSDVGYVQLQAGNTGPVLESSINLQNGVIQITSPAIKLQTTSTSGYVWTASGTDGTGGWAAPSGGGNVTKVGTPVDNQIGVWTGDGTIEGTTGLTYNGSNLQITGDIGSTGTRITKGWFTDLQVTNAIAGSITGNAATVTTNANLTGHITSTGNAAVLGSFTTAQLNTAISDGDVLTAEVDGSISNEGSLTVGAGTGSTSIIDSNTSGSTGVTITAGTGLSISEAGNVITLANTGIITEVDGSTSNELQTITNSSDATSHTVTLSNSGGTVQLIEGSNITITTGGTGSAGTVTIASTGGAYTDEQAQDAVGAMVDASLTYVDGTPLLQRAALTGAVTATAGSNATSLGSFTKAQLDGAVSDGNVLYVGDVTTNATHTGEVTGSGALTVDPTAVSGKTTITTTDTTNDYLLIWDATDSQLKKVAPTNLGLGGGSGLTYAQVKAMKFK